MHVFDVFRFSFFFLFLLGLFKYNKRPRNINTNDTISLNSEYDDLPTNLGKYVPKKLISLTNFIVC